jgi:hypothetical protein
MTQIFEQLYPVINHVEYSKNGYNSSNYTRCNRLHKSDSIKKYSLHKILKEACYLEKDAQAIKDTYNISTLSKNPYPVSEEPKIVSEEPKIIKGAVPDKATYDTIKKLIEKLTDSDTKMKNRRKVTRFTEYDLLPSINNLREILERYESQQELINKWLRNLTINQIIKILYSIDFVEKANYYIEHNCKSMLKKSRIMRTAYYLYKTRKNNKITRGNIIQDEMYTCWRLKAILTPYMPLFRRYIELTKKST